MNSPMWIYCRRPKLCKTSSGMSICLTLNIFSRFIKNKGATFNLRLGRLKSVLWAELHSSRHFFKGHANSCEIQRWCDRSRSEITSPCETPCSTYHGLIRSERNTPPSRKERDWDDRRKKEWNLRDNGINSKLLFVIQLLLLDWLLCSKKKQENIFGEKWHKYACFLLRQR